MPVEILPARYRPNCDECARPLDGGPTFASMTAAIAAAIAAGWKLATTGETLCPECAAKPAPDHEPGA